MSSKRYDKADMLETKNYDKSYVKEYKYKKNFIFILYVTIISRPNNFRLFIKQRNDGKTCNETERKTNK